MPYYDPYVPVTAYTIDAPVLINGVNVNTAQYPALNYKPPASTYPLVYIPAAALAGFGANVYWDSAAQSLIITVPDCRDAIRAMQGDIDILKADSNAEKINEQNYANSEKRTTRVQNITASEIRFDAAPVTFTGNFLGYYTQGQSYPYYPSAASGGQRGIIVKDNFGVWHSFGYRVPI